MKKHHLFSFLLTALSVPAVLLIQEFCPENLYSLRSYLLSILMILVLILSARMEYGEFKVEKEDKEKGKIEEQNERAKKVLSQIIQLTDLKAKCYRENTYDLMIADKEWPVFYGVHNYLHEVCTKLKLTVADIIRAESDYVDVSLIYRYCGEENWKWLAGKSGITGCINLNDFVNDPKTLYNYILSKPEETPVFCNDKTKSEHYTPGRRDKLFANKGSFYAMPITFSNNQEALVDAILLVSTYGVNFIRVGSTKDEEKEFKRILAYEVIPYYVSVIQAELGVLYMRHNQIRIKHIKKEY